MQTYSPPIITPPRFAQSAITVAIVLEHRFCRTPDGTVWTQTTFPYAFWQRYLEVFDHVRVIARVAPVENVSADFKPVTGPHVEVADIPYYIGPWQYLKKAAQVRRAVEAAIAPNDAVILRVSSTLANCVEPLLRSRQQPYAVEVVADPYDVFSPGSVRHPLRPYFRYFYTKALKRQCAHAAAAAYVTQSALQQRYPCSQLEVGVSDVDLPNRAIAPVARSFTPRNLQSQPLKLLYVGTLEQLYKAPHILIQAVAQGIQRGLQLQLAIAGDGQHRAELTALAQSLGIGDHVQFLGQLAGGEGVRQAMQAADLFVLPSFQEGLPRAMVEAMAQALPCIGSRVGGIPELLAPEDLVSPGNVEELATLIQTVATDSARLTTMSQRNLHTAHNYQDELLQQQRSHFYQQVRAITQTWIETCQNF